MHRGRSYRFIDRLTVFISFAVIVTTCAGLCVLFLIAQDTLLYCLGMQSDSLYNMIFRKVVAVCRSTLLIFGVILLWCLVSPIEVSRDHARDALRHPFRTLYKDLFGPK